MSSSRRVADLAEIPVDGTLLVTTERVEDGIRREVIFTRVADEQVVAFENRCQHWRDVRLDNGTGAQRRNGEIVCAKHGAMFDVPSGECVHGPCLGASLIPVPVRVQGGEVVLAEEGWTVLGRGPLEDRETPGTAGRGGLDF